jgi:hypothetical protein
VLNGAVVPHNQIALFPMVAVLELGLFDMLGQE